MEQRARVVLTSLVFALLTVGVAGAQGLAFTIVDGPYPLLAKLNRLDLGNGELTPVGMVGNRATHIAFDSEGSLFSVDYENDQLLTIDVMSGSGTAVGSLGLGIYEVMGLTVDGDDRLWMTARDDVLGSSLYEVDRRTGEATWIAGIAEQYFGGLASHDGTVFIAANTLAEVDTTNGTVTPVPGSTLGIWWTRALDFDDLGALRGLLLCGPCMVPWDVLIVNPIEPETGTLTGDSLNAPHGTWGLAILRGGLFLDGFETGDTDAWSVTKPPVQIDRSVD